MTKRLLPVLVVALALLVPSLAFAGANSFAVAKTASPNGNVFVKVVMNNAQPLAAIDAPLRWSEGATLVNVDFNGSDVEYADFKAANINLEDRTVVMGILFQFGPEKKPELQAGENVLCKLEFRIDNPNLAELKIEAIEMKDPNHSLTYIYHDNGTVSGLNPEFSNVTVSLLNSELPKAYSLGQNFPNPFNPTTTIELALPKAGHVVMHVYNVLGQKVATPVDKHMEAGVHEIVVDGSELASGVYFVNATAEGFSATKKMMLLK